jgi:hypothetical protein
MTLRRMGIEDRDYVTRQRRRNARREQLRNFLRLPWWLAEWLRLAALLFFLWLIWQGWLLLQE